MARLLAAVSVGLVRRIGAILRQAHTATYLYLQALEIVAVKQLLAAVD